jgi:GT2 family glycosyltransferase
MTACPPVTTIVQNWNRSDLLQPCLAALRGQSYPSSEIILVDSGSTDDSVAYVREHFPEVTVMALPCNRGFAAGNNVAIRASNSRYIALLNNDAQPEPYWLEALVDTLATRAEVGFCASKMLYLDDPQIIDTAGDVFYDYGAGGKRGMDQPDGSEFSQTEYVFGACAGAAIYRRAMLGDVGLFDEDFFLYMEDIDLSFRAQLRGHKCLFVPAARVYHQVAGTTGRGSPLSIYYSLRNMPYVLVKNLPIALLVRHLGLILFYFLAGDAVFALSGYTGAVARARRDNLRMIEKMLAKRKRIQSTRRVSDAYIESVMTKGQLGARIRSTLSRLAHGQPLVHR